MPRGPRDQSLLRGMAGKKDSIFPGVLTTARALRSALNLIITSPLQVSSPRFRAAWWGAAACVRASLKCAKDHSGLLCVSVIWPGVQRGGRSCVRSSSVATSSPSVHWILTRPSLGSSVPRRSCLGVTSFRKGTTARGCSSHVS